MREQSSGPLFFFWVQEMVGAERRFELSVAAADDADDADERRSLRVAHGLPRRHEPGRCFCCTPGRYRARESASAAGSVPEVVAKVFMGG